MPALIFDCDGVLAETERDGHLPAYNQAFAEFGLPARWSPEAYGAKIQISGGKERMASLLTAAFVRAAGLSTDPLAQQALLARWHSRKTAIFTELVAAGRLAGLSLHSAAILGNALGAMTAARVGASMEMMEGRDVLALLQSYGQQEAQSEHLAAIQQAIDLISTRFAEREEEKKPWWK
ncbi:MAG: hypothetical protein HGA45_31280 [Chloroflexales bacterium]|nr:hypothetical protein [Chloroflexales bacterium]